MARGNICASLSLDPLPFVTDNSIIKGLLRLDVRKHDAHVGTLIASLSCEERVDQTMTADVVNSQGLEGVPSLVPRGSHEFEFSFDIGSSLAGRSPSMHTTARRASVGIYWTFSIRSDASPDLCVSHIIPVYPARPLSEDASAQFSYQKVQRRVPMIASLSAGPPVKERPKLLTMLFGPSYRIPKDGELREICVSLDIIIPQAGVLQSPNKSGIGLQVNTAAGNAIVLEMCFVKLVSSTHVRDQDRTFTASIDIWKRNLEIILPRGVMDLTDEFATIELPPCPGSIQSQYLQQTYEIRFIMVLRALHVANLTRWVTIDAPITVMPPSISLGDAPPPYVG